MTKPKRVSNEDGADPGMQDRGPVCVPLPQAGMPPDGWIAFYRRFEAPFHREHAATSPEQTAFLLSLFTIYAFDPDTQSLVAVSKDKLFSEFLAPLPDEDLLTLAQAEAALEFLISQSMVVFDGAMISVHPRFDSPSPDSLSSTLAEAAD